MSHRPPLSFILALSLAILFAALHPPQTLAQGPQGSAQPASTGGRIAAAQSFLRALYPAIQGKKYIATVETYLVFDKPGEPTDNLKISIGEGPADFAMGVIGGCFTGSLGPPPFVPRDWPKEWGSPPAPYPPAPVPPPAKPCKIGPVYPKQYLTTRFLFNARGNLSDFSANWPDDGKINDDVLKMAEAHPEMTDAEINAAMKKAGAKYGPDDRDQFIKDLPITQLGRLLGGNLQVLSVTAEPLDPDRSQSATIWPEWIVLAKLSAGGADIKYEMHFDPVTGLLSGLVSPPYQRPS